MKPSDLSKSSSFWIATSAVLIIINCLALIPSMAYVPLLIEIRKTITMTDSQVGLFAGLAGVMAIACAIPAGMAIKRFGAGRVLLTGGAFMVAGLLILSFSEHFSIALSGRGVWQGGLRFFHPALLAILVVAVPEKYRSTALGVNMSVSMVGTIIAQNLGARVSQLWGWPAAIQLFAFSVFLGVIIFLFFYKGNTASKALPPEDQKKNMRPGVPKERSVYATPSVWLVCLLIIFACEEGLVDSFAGFQMEEIWGTDAVEFAKVLSMGIFIAIFVNLGAGWCGDRYGRWNMFIIFGLLNSMVGVCLLIGQTGNKTIYILGLLIAKALQLVTLILVNSMAPTFLGGRDVGPLIAIFALGGGLGQYIGPQAIGILKDVTGTYTAGWVFTIACGLVATMIAIGFKIYFERKEISKPAEPAAIGDGR